MPRSAVFLDRDGVINRERRTYVRSWSDFEFLPGALEALVELNRLGAPVVVVTNQSVVGRELISEPELAVIHDRMREAISVAGGRIDAIYACTHAPQAGCDCRKPAPGLLIRAAEELGISLCDSVMIGDALTDVQAACAAGCQPLLVASTPNNRLHPSPIEVHDLRHAVDFVAGTWRSAVAAC